MVQLEGTLAEAQLEIQKRDHRQRELEEKLLELQQQQESERQSVEHLPDGRRRTYT